MARLQAGENRGFSLVELVIGMAVLTFTMTTVFYILGKYQRVYQTEQVGADMLQGARGTLELLSQEIGQAGYLSLPAGRKLTPAVTANAAAQTAAASSTADLFVGEKLLVDGGANEELVTLTGVSDTGVQGIFTKNHVAQTPINALGVFPDGVLPGSSTPTRLQLYGDINGDGSLVYVEYNCDTTTGTPTSGTVTRSVTPITTNGVTATVQNTPRVVLTGLQPNPGGTACFQYTTKPLAGVAGVPTVVNRVLITLTTRTASPDPETKTYRSATSSLVVTPGNTLLVFDVVQYMPNRLQSKPFAYPPSPPS